MLGGCRSRRCSVYDPGCSRAAPPTMAYFCGKVGVRIIRIVILNPIVILLVGPGIGSRGSAVYSREEKEGFLCVPRIHASGSYRSIACYIVGIRYRIYRIIVAEPVSEYGNFYQELRGSICFPGVIVWFRCSGNFVIEIIFIIS